MREPDLTLVAYSDDHVLSDPANSLRGRSSFLEDADGADDDSPVSGIRSLDRPFMVLRVLRENRFPMRLTEIASATKLHLATTQRIVNLLIKHHYIERNGVEYRLGLVSLIDGFTYLLTNSLTQTTEPVLLELTAATKMSSTLSVRYDLTQVKVLVVLSTPLPRYQVMVGEQVSLLVGGARVLASALEEEDLERLLEGVESIPLASGTILGREEFVESLGAIRERGYALGQGQGVGGTVSIAVPVKNHLGEVVAAIEVFGHIEDIQLDVDTLVSQLKRASAAVTQRMR